MRRIALGIVISIVIMFGLFATVFAQIGDKQCEQCSMTVDTMGQARFKIYDSNGTRHYACCPMCTLKLLNRLNGVLNITSYCDYYGPNYPIQISIKANGSQITVNPTTALIINGAGCTKNRIVYNSTAADALLAPPNNGTSQWLSPMTNATVLSNATRMSVVQAVAIYGVPEFSTVTLVLMATGLGAFAVFATKRLRRPPNLR